MSTMNSIATAMFTVGNQDAAIAWYTEKLGWKVRSDTAFGEGEQAGRVTRRPVAVPSPWRRAT